MKFAEVHRFYSVCFAVLAKNPDERPPGERRIDASIDVSDTKNEGVPVYNISERSGNKLAYHGVSEKGNFPCKIALKGGGRGVLKSDSFC